MERLKRVRGTVDVKDEEVVTHHKPSEVVKLNAGVNISQDGKRIEGPKLKNKFRSTLQDYFKKRDKNDQNRYTNLKRKKQKNNVKSEKSIIEY